MLNPSSAWLINSLNIFALAAALFSASCAEGSKTLDMGFKGSARGLARAKLAAETWNATCDTILIQVHEGDAKIAITEQEGLTHNAYGETYKHREFLGIIGEEEAYWIWTINDDHQLIVLTHEFGHALGLGHAETGIMHPGASYDMLDPETNFQTIMPGMITQEDCQQVMKNMLQP
jgi:hypothetical protein